MNVICTQYTLKHRSFEIVLAGCKGESGVHCNGCHSPQTWGFNQGDNWRDVVQPIIDKIYEFQDMIDWIWVYGGEPIDQDFNELKEMLIRLGFIIKPILLFTRYDFDLLPIELHTWCDYIKCGKYIPELKTEDNIQYGIELATSNQKIFKKGKDY